MGISNFQMHHRCDKNTNKEDEEAEGMDNGRKRHNIKRAGKKIAAGGRKQ